MSWVENTAVFKHSRNKDKILAAFTNPINHELVQQVETVVDSEYAKAIEDEEFKNKESAEITEEDRESSEDENTETKKSAKDKSSRPASFSPAPTASPKGGTGLDEPLEKDEEKPKKENDVEESTSISSPKIQASTYVTIETVSQVVQEIPGVLNLREDTQGATYATLKGGTSNEIWIYFEDDVDLNKILESVNRAIVSSGYYFLEFNRVSRDDNAIIFTVNWVSSYFHPAQLIGEENG